MSTTTFTFTDAGGWEIFTYKWAPDEWAGPLKGAVQVVHGAAEHAGRYERFAKFLNARGYVVYGDDHRGHGKTAGDLARAGIAGENGWEYMLQGELQLTKIIKEENPGLPVFLFGHSMGSFMGQQYIERWGGELQGVILSGSTGLALIPPEALPGMAQAAAGAGRDQLPPDPGALFAPFNKPFEPAKTPFDWLTRDEAEVQKYINDPWCGFAFTNGMTYGMAVGINEMIDPGKQALIPKDLPVLLLAGEMDPVGAHDGVLVLGRRYSELGIADVEMLLYPEGRHEMLNELNRDQVHADVAAWLDKHL